MADVLYISFLFILGACVGSFLNVVVWRWPRGESLISPGSHCPRCGHALAWRDNIPVLGWILLRGRCRYCKAGISPRYPVIEFTTGAIFVFYYVMFFMLHVGPCAPEKLAMGTDVFGRTLFANRMPASLPEHWPIYGLYMFLLSALLAVSLIDAETFTIPSDIPWGVAAVGIFVHALIDHPTMPGAVNVGREGLLGAVALGGGAGLVVGIVLFQLGVLPVSFPRGEPSLDVDKEAFEREVEAAKRENRPPPELPPVYTPGQIRGEMWKEMLFMAPPVVGAILAVAVTRIGGVEPGWRELMGYHWVTGLLGAVLGALVGAGLVWIARILGTLAMGRVAMGLGDVHLMFGVGAVVGAGAVVVAFFLAPFAGLAIGLYMFLARRQREMPYGPYLSLATAAVMLLYCPIADHLRPGLQGLLEAFRGSGG